MSDPTEVLEEYEPVTTQSEMKPKRERTPAQLEALRKARELANAKRKENAELKRKEKELKAKEQHERKRAIEQEYQKKMGGEPEPEDEEEEEEPQPKTKKKPMKILKEEPYLDESPQIKSLIRKVDYLVERKLEKEEKRRAPAPAPAPQPEIKRSLFYRGFE